MRGVLGPLKRKGGLKEATVVLGLLLAVTFVRFFYASVLALSADEAYYWQWSRHLAWGYFDHPPMIAYVIAAGTRIAGINPLGVRLLSVIMAGGTAWMLYRMALGLKGAREAGLWALALSIFTPLFSAGAFLSTPDVPFVFFWTAAIWRIQRAVYRSRLRDWSGAGLLMGLVGGGKHPLRHTATELVAEQKWVSRAAGNVEETGNRSAHRSHKHRV